MAIGPPPKTPTANAIDAGKDMPHEKNANKNAVITATPIATQVYHFNLPLTQFLKQA
nr:hypothetical protein [uncultured Flavobacterium sp.]